MTKIHVKCINNRLGSISNFLYQRFSDCLVMRIGIQQGRWHGHLVFSDGQRAEEGGNMPGFVSPGINKKKFKNTNKYDIIS